MPAQPACPPPSYAEIKAFPAILVNFLKQSLALPGIGLRTKYDNDFNTDGNQRQGRTTFIQVLR
jgi:hypothetical protein